ncbi:class I SAM-dependent methyltransferase [Paludisphaera borealis]|uniref:Ubiquinone biosynthesis O-methyltransferase n=1 Tax=Paludisphaera borealis TaxID=1387353 RepID=A0A1U7CMW6_9BACT|nr:class I SAM-dependent methyltransferase [Paludisphaera borealis]APW60267.1 Ubiquinone biosynthesis O-methyltransferase [Paludisphaera borealis]
MSKIPLPRVVKRPLVAVWNASHRLGWLARDYASAIAHGRIEPCSVCGKTRPMLYRRRVIPNRLVELWGLSPGQAVALARKESSDCSACGAKLRARRLAEVLLNLYPTGARSLRDWTRSAVARDLRIAEINRIDGLHEALKGLPGFQPSDFTPGASPGSVVDGVRCENFTRLTYPDAYFDLVLTSETLEHVPDLATALAECRRVLAPGGRHVFTAPVSPNVSKTFPRARLGPDGSVEHLAPSISHPGGDWGYPVFTELGTDFPDILRQAGFETEIRFGPISDDDLAQVYVCRKP